MDRDAFEKILKISEQFFGTESDPDQMPVSQESADKLNSIHLETIQYEFDEEGNPIAWSVIVPTSRIVMDKFVKKEISEKELLDIAVKEKKFEALYLCAVFVLPEFRRKGIAKKLILKGIEKLSLGKDLPLYCWIYSEEGKKLEEVLSEEFGKEIARREE